MTDTLDLDYLIVRERQSRDLARQSGDVPVRLAHVAMADLYAVRISAARRAIAP